MAAIGDMKQIQLEDYTAVKDGNGRWTETPTLYNVNAEVVKQGSGRQLRDGQTQLNNTMQFKTWFRTDWDITGDWKLVYDGKRYTISGIDKMNERNFNWLINATAVGKS